MQSIDEKVKIYDEYYAKNALIQQKNGELRISSFEKDMLTVLVYVNNLSEINATGNAVVKTSGKFNTPELTINLKDQVFADLNINAVELSSSVTGHAKLVLSGLVESYNSSLEGFASVDMAQFTAWDKIFRAKNPVVAQNALINKAQVLETK